MCPFCTIPCPFYVHYVPFLYHTPLMYPSVSILCPMSFYTLTPFYTPYVPFCTNSIPFRTYFKALLHPYMPLLYTPSVLHCTHFEPLLHPSVLFICHFYTSYAVLHTLPYHLHLSKVDLLLRI